MGLGFSALRAISTIRAADEVEVLELKRADTGVRRAAKAAFMGRRWKIRPDIVVDVCGLKWIWVKTRWTGTRGEDLLLLSRQKGVVVVAGGL